MEPTDSPPKWKVALNRIINFRKKKPNKPVAKPNRSPTSFGTEPQSGQSSSPPETLKPPNKNPETQDGTAAALSPATIALNDESAAGTEEPPNSERRDISSGHQTAEGPEPSKSEALPPISTLWDEVYDELSENAATAKLIVDYQRALKESAPIGEISKKRDERRKQMENLVVEKTREVEEGTWKFRFKDHEFAVKDLVKPVVSVIEWGKDFVGQAVQVSPPASLAWVGVCLLLPVSQLSLTSGCSTRY
jgi:hypothetical protein